MGIGTSDTIAYSTNGITWTGSGKTIFSTGGYGLGWNGNTLIAVGQGINSIAYSIGNAAFVGIGSSIFSSAGYGVAWNGIRWVAVGLGTNTIAYSVNGINWFGIGNNIFSTSGNAVAGNSQVGAAIVKSAIILDSNIFPQTSNLDVIGSQYYNEGYNNLSINIVSSSL